MTESSLARFNNFIFQLNNSVVLTNAQHHPKTHSKCKYEKWHRIQRHFKRNGNDEIFCWITFTDEWNDNQATWHIVISIIIIFITIIAVILPQHINSRIYVQLKKFIWNRWKLHLQGNHLVCQHIHSIPFIRWCDCVCFCIHFIWVCMCRLWNYWQVKPKNYGKMLLYFSPYFISIRIHSFVCLIAFAHTRTDTRARLHFQIPA